MSEKGTPSVDQLEQTFKDNPRIIQFLTEQQRYKQQARLRALDLAFQQNRPPQIKDSLDNSEPIFNGCLVEANAYYNWLIDILPDQLF